MKTSHLPPTDSLDTSRPYGYRVEHDQSRSFHPTQALPSPRRLHRARTRGDDRRSSHPISRRGVPNDPKTAEVACIAWGLARGLGKGIEVLCEVLEIPIEDEHIELLDSLDWPRLQDALYTLRTERRWP